MMRIVLGIATVATLGCSIDLVGPDPNLPAFISSRLVVEDHGPIDLSLTAQFKPGTDRDGLPRQLADSNLRTVAGVLPPITDGAEGSLHYMSEAVDVSTLDSLVAWVVSPAVSGTSTAPPLLTIPLIVRSGRDSLLLAAGTDALFPLAGVPNSTEGVEWAWDLTLSTADSGVSISIRLGDRGLPPPAGLTVPANLVAPFAGREATAQLLVTGVIFPSMPDADYFASLSVRTVLRWKIHVKK